MRRIINKNYINESVDYVVHGTLDPIDDPEYDSKEKSINWDKEDVSRYTPRMEFLGKIGKSNSRGDELYGIKYYSPNGRNSEVMELIYADYKRILDREKQNNESLNEALKSNIARKILSSPIYSRFLNAGLRHPGKLGRLKGSNIKHDVSLEEINWSEITDDDFVIISPEMASKLPYKNNLNFWAKKGKIFAVTLSNKVIFSAIDFLTNSNSRLPRHRKNYYYLDDKGDLLYSFVPNYAKKADMDTIPIKFIASEADEVYSMINYQEKEKENYDLRLSRMQNKKDALALKSNKAVYAENMARYKQILNDKKRANGYKDDIFDNRVENVYSKLIKSLSLDKIEEINPKKINMFQKLVGYYQNYVEAKKDLLDAPQNSTTYASLERYFNIQKDVLSDVLKQVEDVLNETNESLNEHYDDFAYVINFNKSNLEPSEKFDLLNSLVDNKIIIRYLNIPSSNKVTILSTNSPKDIRPYLSNYFDENYLDFVFSSPKSHIIDESTKQKLVKESIKLKKCEKNNEYIRKTPIFEQHTEMVNSKIKKLVTLVAKAEKAKFEASKKPEKLKVIDLMSLNKKPVKELKPCETPKGIKVIDITKASKIKVEDQKIKGVDTLNKVEVIENKPEPQTTIKDTIELKQQQMDKKLGEIMETIKKQNKVHESIKSQYPFTSYLSEEDRIKFNSLSETQKEIVTNRVNEAYTTDPNMIKKIWESALQNKPEQEPLWLTTAPDNYKKLYESASPEIKESIKARAEFVMLDTPERIENFWECSGLGKTNILTESFIAVPVNNSNMDPIDNMIASIGDVIKERFN